MAYSGGVFSRLYNWVTDRDGGVKIQASRMDAEMDGMATALSTCVLKDGTQTITANIPLSGFKLTGVGDATTSGDALHYGQIGSAVQAYDADLTAIAGLTSAADKIPYYTGSGTASLADFTSAARNLLDDTDASAMRATLGVSIGSDVQVYDADILKADTADVLTAGFAGTPYNAGTKSSGTFTPDEANGNLQYAVNGGAHTLAPPSNNTSICIQYTNNASAGAITTSGFTAVTGDTITTTNGHDFFFYIMVNNSKSHLHVQALQ